MKKLKSLTGLLALILVSACNGHSSAAFSSTQDSSSFETTSSLNESSSLTSSEVVSSSSETSSSQVSSSSLNSSSSTQQNEDPYGGYYSALTSWTDGEDLKNQLNAIIRNGYKPLTYTKSSKQNYDSNINADHSKYDFEYLDVIYSNKNTFKTETNKGWQREHAWCASLMCGSTTGNAINYKGRATDFHNLFAANASGNQSRGNKNYGYADVFDTFYSDQYMTDDGNDGYSYDEITFEPGDIDKGRLTRAIFYMATMYKDDEVDTANNINMKGLQIVEEPVSYVPGNNCHFAIGNLTDLLEWNEDVPVDYLEMQHNISVYTDTNNPDGIAQGNRNPYVDYPELVDYVYGSKKNQAGSLNNLTPSMTNLVSSGQIEFHYAIKEAKREYGLGEMLSARDYKIVSVLDDFKVLDASMVSSIFNSLDGHTFAESDGDSIEATIVTTSNRIKYQINLNPMGLCSHNVTLSSSGISPTIHSQDQNVSFGGIPFVVNYDTSIASGATFYIRNISAGGVTLGSSNSELTRFSIETRDSYTVDRVYIKACASNTTSSYKLTIKVGDTVLLQEETVSYLKNGFTCFGGHFAEPVTGKISYVFTGSTALKINSIAFNSILS